MRRRVGLAKARYDDPDGSATLVAKAAHFVADQFVVTYTSTAKGTLDLTVAAGGTPSHATVGQILVQHGRLSDDDLARAFAARYGLGHIDLDEFEVDPEAANLLPPEAARRYNAVPLAFEPDGSLVVAMADPSDSLALSDIAFMTHLEVRAAVAAAGRLAELAARLPLPPTRDGGSRFPVAATPEEPAPPPDVVEFAPPAPPPPPTVDSGELDRARAELDGTRSELDATRSELDTMRSELESARTELQTTRDERDGARAELDAVRAEFETMRAELETMRVQLEQATQSAAEAEGRVAELGDTERRVAEAHAMADQMRNEFELEREGYAATERELRAKLDRTTGLVDAYETARRRAAKLARRAEELASTLEEGALDDAPVVDDDLGVDGEEAAYDEIELTPHDGPAESAPWEGHHEQW